MASESIPETSNDFDVESPTLEIAGTSESVKTAIKSKSVENMPDNPSEMGWKANDIKKRFYLPIYDDKNSVLAEINRVITEINDAFVEALEYIKKIEVAAATSDAGKVDKIDMGGIVYGTESDKDPIGLQYSSNMVPWAIARYNAKNENDEGKATFKVGKPLTDDDATPKSYVNDLVKDLIKEVSFTQKAGDIFELKITTKDDKSTTTEVDLHLESLVTKVDEIEENGVYYLQLTFQDGSTAKYALDDIFAGVKDLLDNIKATIAEQGVEIEKKVNRILYSAASVIKGDTAVYAVDENNKPRLLPVKLMPGTYTVVRRDAAGHVIVPDLKENSPIDAAINKKDMQKLDTSLTNKINDKGEEVKAYTDGQITEAKQYSDDQLAPIENRVSALENTLLTLERDTSVAYAKAVPANSYPKAFLNSIGGMTYRKVADNLFPCPEEGITRIVEPMIGFGEVYLPAGTYSYSVDATYEYEEEDRFSYLGFMSNPYNATDPMGFVELSAPFTLAETTKVYLIGIKEGAYMGGNVTAKVMLNSGSTVKAFSAYFPPYLEDSKVTEVISHGANLLDLSKAVNKNFVDNGDGTYTFTRTDADWSGRFSAEFPLNIPEGAKFSTYGEKLTDAQISMQFFKEDGTSATDAVGFNGGTFVRTNNGIVKARLYIPTSVVVGDVVKMANPRINIGSTTLPYTPYREPIRYPIPEAIQAQSGYGVGHSYNRYGTIKSYPNYFEVIDKDKIKFYLQSYRATLNGTEAWTMAVAGKFRLSRGAIINVANSKFIHAEAANRYNALDEYQDYLDGKEGIYAASSAALYIHDYRFTTLDAFKAYLASEPLDIIYAIDKVVETDLTASFDKKIDVFPCGYLEFKNDKGNAVPSDVAFITNK